jgi:hypothetical protein
VSALARIFRVNVGIVELKSEVKDLNEKYLEEIEPLFGMLEVV